MRYIWIGAALAAGCVVALAGGGVQYTAEVVTPLDGFGFVTPRAIAADGTMAGYSGPTLDEYPILGVTGVAGGQASALPTPNETPVFVFGMSGNGSRQAGSSAFRAVVWNGGVATDLSHDITSAGLFGGIGAAWDVNDGGLIVGDVDTGIIHFVQAVYWERESVDPKLLPGLAAKFSPGTAQGVNNAGQVVGTAQDGLGSHFAVRWDSVTSDPVNLGTLDGYNLSNGIGISDGGDVAGIAQNSSTFAIEGFHWNGETQEMAGIGHLPSAVLSVSEAYGVNDAGEVVGTSNAGPGVAHAVLWRDGVLHDLNDLVAPIPGVLYLVEARAVNEAGQIAAAGVTGEGPGYQDRVMVLLSPVIPGPCPGDANEDGVVNSLDLNAVLGAFGCVSEAPAQCPFDTNDDGKVDSLDLNDVLGAFGQPCDSPASAIADDQGFLGLTANATITNSTIAPTVAVRSSPSRFVDWSPSRPKRNPPTTAPSTPMIRLPTMPKPRPLSTSPARKPATRPMSRNQTYCMAASFAAQCT